VYVNESADGFRLPTSAEWELAARYAGKSGNTVPGYTDPYLQRGDSATGAGSSWSNSETMLYAVYGTGKAATVGSRRPNGLGLYDMSGNVYELCFDSGDGSENRRAIRGGSYIDMPSYMAVGKCDMFTPEDTPYNDIGLRVVRTQ
jgi:formylglycine-generating enzyme required for sulfatase activity